MNTILFDYKKRLVLAYYKIKNNLLYNIKKSTLSFLILESYANVYNVNYIDLHNLLCLGLDFLFNPKYPSGCSVGGGISKIFFDLKDYKKYKNEIIDHNLKLIWSVFEITAEGSAAGYDSHGITLSVLDLKNGTVKLVCEKTSGDIDERGHITISNLLSKCPEIETGEALVIVTGAQTRAATQGDNMYSRANAHLHNDYMTREVFNEIMNLEELEYFRSIYPLRINCNGPFSVGHNGDVNSKIKWEKYFLNLGFESKADSDSKEIPRIIRMVYECLMADKILKTNYKYLSWFIDSLYYNQVLSEYTKFDDGKNQKIIHITEQKDLIIDIAKRFTESNATIVTTACAIAALLIYLVDPTSIFVFETLTDIVESNKFIPVTTIVRGPKSGGMFIYLDKSDSNVPIKFASSLSNMRNQIPKYENEKIEEISVDYISSGAKIIVREGSVSYYSLSDWQIAEITQSDEGCTPVLKIYNILEGNEIDKKLKRSPIIDYQLKGTEKSAILKEYGYFLNKSRVERTVVYETILGKIVSGPTFLKGKQIKNFLTEEPVTFAIDNQYGVEIYLSYVTLLRNTRNIFKFENESNSENKKISLNLKAFFNETLTEKEIHKILRKVNKIYGFAEGTSRNILGLSFSVANLEGLNGCFTNVLESNLARIEKPYIDEETLVLFVSNSGGTKPVVALAEELISKTDPTFNVGPYIMSITNLITSELAILTSKSLGASVTNMPWEKAVGSTFAAFTAMQNILALLIYIHEVKGLIKPQRAQYLYNALADFPNVAKKILSASIVKEKTKALAKYIAGNGIDISFVGAFNGYDGYEGALKFAEMMQHPRVKFFSGAYEQHGQRATYLRSNKTSHGSLVILHIPNLETSIGSWMAQLIKEDKPRVGKIAVIAAEEDLIKLYENGADFVIPAPTSTTSNLFTDALSKLLLDNLLTFATIIESNKIADELIGYGNRILELCKTYKHSHEAIPIILKELKIIWKKYKKLEIGGIDAKERIKTIYELESQRVDGIISDEERDLAVSKLYKDLRLLSIINAETRSYIDDLFTILLNFDINNKEETQIFYNLLYELILEFSNRSLAMEISDERFDNSPYLSKTSIHYQGLAKIIGANPIKPDNIAKFQQGWGISSFILNPGQRFSDVVINFNELFENIEELNINNLNELKSNLIKAKFNVEDALRLCAILKFVKIKKLSIYDARFTDSRHYKFIKQTENENSNFEYTISPEFIECVVKNKSSNFNVSFINGSICKIENLFIDKYGDIQKLIVLETEFDIEKITNKINEIYLEDEFIKKQINFLKEWFPNETNESIIFLLSKILPIKFITYDKKELVKQFEMLKDKRNLIESVPKFKEIFEMMNIDPYGISINDLKTMRNISNAILKFNGGSPYIVQKKFESGKIEYYAVRDREHAFGISLSKSSAFDKPNRLRGNKKIACVGGRLKMGYGRDGAPVIIIPWRNINDELSKIILLHAEIDENLSIGKKIETLGEKYNLIVNHVSEHFEWDDNYLNLVSMRDLMMLSDEEVADNKIVEKLKSNIKYMNNVEIEKN